MMQPIKGCKPYEKDVVVFAAGGFPNPKTVVPEAGLLVFNTEGGVPEPDTPVSGGDDVVGVGVGVVVTVGVGVAVAAGDDDVDDDGKMQEPVLGFELTITAAPPKSQLVGTGFF